MSFLFDGPSKPDPVPLPAPLPPAPERSDVQTQQLADQQRKRFAGAGGGRVSTYLTSGGTTSGSAAVRFLGGAART